MKNEIKDKWIKPLTCYLFKVWLFWKKVTIFRKNLKIDNYSYRLKNKTRQNKELKYRQKNIVCLVDLLGKIYTSRIEFLTIFEYLVLIEPFGSVSISERPVVNSDYFQIKLLNSFGLPKKAIKNYENYHFILCVNKNVMIFIVPIYKSKKGCNPLLIEYLNKNSNSKESLIATNYI